MVGGEVGRWGCREVGMWGGGDVGRWGCGVLGFLQGSALEFPQELPMFV